MNGPAGKDSEFYVAFYDLFVATSAEAASKFKNTDMAEQVRMLRASVATLVTFFATGGESGYVRKLADRHGKHGADISPGLYAVWLDCLIETVRRFDAKFDDGVATAWRAVFSKGIEFMTSRYDSRGEDASGVRM